MADNTIDVLEDLIETCRDGQAGYRDAAEHAHDSELKEFFAHQSLERAKFSGELESMAQRLGKADPDRSPSISNRLHRAWFELKEKLGAGDASLLESVETGEDSAKKRFEEALNSKLPNDIRLTVERQCQSVIAAHDRVRNLRDRYKRAA